MAMLWKSNKYVKVDMDNLDGVGMCDSSGFMFNRRDMRKQMEWRGNSLAWTGLIVGVPFLDQPNQFFRPPPIDTDPKPIHDPRPPFPNFDPTSPPVTSYPQIIDQINSESFYNHTEINLGVPNEIPGWPNDFDSPPYLQLLAQLSKVTFS